LGEQKRLCLRIGAAVKMDVRQSEMSNVI